MTAIPQCEECRQVWLPADVERGRCYFDDENHLVFYCPNCAEREFDDGTSDAA